MKIIWLSNKLLLGKDCGNTGTWLDSMAHELTKSNMIQLGNISTGKVDKITRQDCGQVQQWIIPNITKLNNNGLPSEKIISDIINVIESFSPDLVHVWGTENFWGLLTARKCIRRVALLEIQGLKYAIANVFHGGLTAKEQLSCIGLKEIVKKSMIWQGRRRFAKWGRFEKEIISQHQYITVQSRWANAQVKSVNPVCTVLENALLLREAFYSALPWHYTGKHQIFCSAAYSSPFKGLHVAIRAVAILKNKFPQIKLNIAGAHQKKGLRQDGYIAWLNKEIKRLGIDLNVNWIGPLNAPQIVSELQASSAMVLPSFIENSSNAMQEAMILGVPVVATYTGGLSSTGKDEISALFFPLDDEAMCAHQLDRVITDQELATRLSEQSRKIAMVRNDRERIVKTQFAIYNDILNSSKFYKK
ncbi:MAG: glycosyltransferase family 4 protein [Desulfamplus sp.]